MSKRVYLDSIGCRLNQSEIDTMARQFSAQGYTVVESAEQADLFVVNTCAVTRNAGKDSRKLIRRLNKTSPDAEITVTGCYGHLVPETVVELPGVIRVVDNFNKERLVHEATGADFDLEPLERHYTPGTNGMTRAFVKVQDGCDNECTFCITTIARGASRSRPVENIVREVQAMAAGGYQEIVLTGVNLGAYGYDFGNTNGLRDLILALLSATDIPRIRLSSLEPWNLDEDFFRLWENPRMCAHLHLPLQSGCDATLKRMRRRTNQREFRALVEAARANIPNLALSTDFIAGFPGETEAEFEASLSFAEAMDFMKMHVFPFSARAGTAAVRIKERVNPTVIKERVQRALALSNAGEDRYYKKQIGQIAPVLWEGVRGSSDAGFLHTGLTDTYVRVEATSQDVLTNRITPTHLTAPGKGGMLGVIENRDRGVA